MRTRTAASDDLPGPGARARDNLSKRLLRRHSSRPALRFAGGDWSYRSSIAHAQETFMRIIPRDK